MNFLIDNSVSPVVAQRLREAGHDAVHVRDYGLQQSDDKIIFDRATAEERIIVSADTDFGTLLAERKATKPSVILFRGKSPRRPEVQARLLTVNLATMIDSLDQGSIIVVEDGRLRSRALPIGSRS